MSRKKNARKAKQSLDPNVEDADEQVQATSLLIDLGLGIDSPPEERDETLQDEHEDTSDTFVGELGKQLAMFEVNRAVDDRELSGAPAMAAPSALVSAFERSVRVSEPKFPQ